MIRRSLRPYLAIARINARSAYVYRMNLTLSAVGALCQLLAMFAVWGVLLANGRTIADFSWPQMKAYLLIVFITGALVASFGEFRMAFRIQDGTVSLDLVKPVDYQLVQLAQSLGGVWLEVCIVVFVTAGTVLLAGPIATPTLGQGLLFALSLLVVIPIKFLIIYLSSMLCFWTQNYVGVFWSRQALAGLFSGTLVPLALLPGWMQSVAGVLPFASTTSVPAMIYLGRVSGGDAVRLIGLQLFWAVVMWMGARLAWRGALRQLTVHGG